MTITWIPLNFRIIFFFFFFFHLFVCLFLHWENPKMRSISNEEKKNVDFDWTEEIHFIFLIPRHTEFAIWSDRICTVTLDVSNCNKNAIQYFALNVSRILCGCFFCFLFFFVTRKFCSQIKQHSCVIENKQKRFLRFICKQATHLIDL